MDEVKPVDEKNPPPLYEIRWQGISVTNRLADNTTVYSTVVVRMYHSEPASAPEHFIGHHAHEKDVSTADVNAAQQIEINVAKSMYKLGEVVNWGIAS